MEGCNYKFDLSVIIPTYNQSSLLEYTLASLVKQTVSEGSFEVIVADDGSSDDTKQVAERFSDRLDLKYAFQEDKGYRPGSARNMGIRIAEGKVCLFIDSSVILHPNCVQEHIRFYAGCDSGRAAIGYVYGFDWPLELDHLLKKLLDPGNPFGSLGNGAMRELFLDVREEHYAAHRHRIEDLPAPWVFYWTCHVSAMRGDLAGIGMFDEKYDGKWGMEDFDIGFRLHNNGVRIALLKSAESIHYPHSKDMSERKLQGFQNCIYFHEKFRTFETEVYLRNYHHIETIDVNSLCLQLAESKSSASLAG